MNTQIAFSLFSPTLTVLNPPCLIQFCTHPRGVRVNDTNWNWNKLKDIDIKRISILIEAVLPTLPMLYLPFNVYLDSKRVSVLIEAVFANITNVVPSLQWISWFEESKHTHRSSFANITNVVPSLHILIRREQAYIEAVLPTLPMLYMYLPFKDLNEVLILVKTTWISKPIIECTFTYLQVASTLEKQMFFKWKRLCM